MSLLGCRLLDAPCSRRKLLASAMKPPCSLYWFLLVLAAGSLLILVHLQDLCEMVQQQTPGERFVVAPSWPVGKDPDSPRGAVGDVGATPSGPAHPRQPAGFQWLPDSPVSNPERSAKPPVTKRHRKLLLKSGPVGSSAPAGEEEEEEEEEEEDERRRTLARTQESCRRVLREVCAKYQPGVAERPVSRRQVSRVFVEDRSRLLYCEVPKAGCSNWKRVLMVLGGSAASARAIPHDDAHYANRLRRLDAYDGAGIAERLRSYTKVLFVREPFERLVSAFRDKFESPNSYYHPVFGRPIISRYRANATRAALRTGAGVTFREFVRYLLDIRRPVGMDIHWEPVSQLCSPCLLRYNFIGKFESLEEEANFLLRSIGAPGNLTFPDFKDRNPNAERTSSEITRRYFAQLNSTERQRAYDFYYMDYLMFNYPKPFKDLY